MSARELLTLDAETEHAADVMGDEAGTVYDTPLTLAEAVESDDGMAAYLIRSRAA